MWGYHEGTALTASLQLNLAEMMMSAALLLQSAYYVLLGELISAYAFLFISISCAFETFTLYSLN